MGKPVPPLLGGSEPIVRKRTKLEDIPVVIRRGIHVPADMFSEEQIRDAQQAFTYRYYNDAKCAKCEYYPERHCDTCDECPAYNGGVVLSKIEKIGKHQFLSMPMGDKKRAANWLRKQGYQPGKVYRKLIEGTPIKPFNIVRKPWPYQEKAAQDLFEKKMGVLESAPRTGKTVIGAMLVQKVLRKTLILAHQEEWLDNFQETFVGSKKEKPFTDIEPSRVGKPKTVEDVAKYDVCLVSMAKFFRGSFADNIEKILDQFGVIIVDECQIAPAKVSSTIVNRFKSKYRVGLSGSPDRKDGRFSIFVNQVGPVIHKTDATALRPKVVPIFTDMTYKIKRSRMAFTILSRQMETRGARRDRIIDLAIRAAEHGHFVILPLKFVRNIDDMVKDINSRTDERWAEAFHGQIGKVRRREIIEAARKFKFRILVSNISLISTGVNIPRASCLIDGITPTSNLPKARQRFSRILTPHPDKPTPIILFLLDKGTPAAMRRNEFYNCLIREFKPQMRENDARRIREFFLEANA